MRATRVILFLLGLSTGATAQQVSPVIKAASAILVDARTGEVLFEKNADAPRAVASTQKLLTALLIAERGDLDSPMQIEPVDTQCDPTMLYLKPGDSYLRRDLLNALMVKSANDVARALARDNAGSVEEFVEKMNRRAFVLGAEKSNFVNPNGLPAEGQFSCARDMAKIALAAYEIPEIRSAAMTKLLQFQYADGRTVPLQNTNRVMRENDFCNGMKTGYTNLAGHCLVSSGMANDREVIAVVLGSSKPRVWTESANLLRFGLGLPIRPEPTPAPKKPPKKSTKTKRSTG